ncbi:collagen-like protein [Aquimarina rhabdastrellae]
MKKLITLLSLVLIAFTACEGPEGPPGRDGLDGQDGETILAKAFEITADFNAANNYAINVVVPNTIEVFDSDVALVYLRDPAASSTNGADVWEPLPRTFFFNGGGYAQFQFNFLFDESRSIFDLDIFIESDDPGALDASFTQNQDFRIVIVPADFAQNNDVSNLNEVLATLNIDSTQIPLLD